MTRLTTRDIHEIPDQLNALDQELADKAGVTLFELAASTARIDSAGLAEKMSALKLAVIPISAGQGIIGGFSQSLHAIAGHLGMEVRVTTRPDVAGMAEAATDRADLWMLSDDDCFIAWNTRTRTVVDNSRATGEGYAVLLDRMGGGVKNEKCLVLGCGPVGTSAARRLLQMGADVILCDEDHHQAEKAMGVLQTGSDRRPAIARMDMAWPLCRLILDATPVPDLIPEHLIDPDKIVVSPGVPPGVTRAGIKKLNRRFYHDVLPLGVAVMIAAAVAGHHWPGINLSH